MKLKAIIGVIFFIFTQSAFAQLYCAQYGNQLTGIIGLDSNNGSIYTNITSETNECSCREARFLPENTDTDKALSILLAARLSGKTVRIDFLEGQGCNSATRVYIQD
ncbi:hypothetical protein [Sessilibacter corallicola]|uniref:Uncharacterized protein n=1 Tax=Sessilibacter corallicola TaxID=2904075 RepID=A0ABQ0A7J6_9GAMM